MAKKKTKRSSSEVSVPEVRVQKMQEAVRGMSPALQTVYKRIKSRLDQIRKKAVQLSYEIGEDVLKVEKSPHKYGEKAVTKLAVGLGMAPSPKKNPLGKARLVTTAWTRHKIIELMEAAEAHGNEFTVSHFEELAVLRGEEGLKDRARLEDEVIRLGISTSELHREIVACTKGTRSPAPSGNK